MSLIIPQGYDPKLDIRETQNAIRYIHDVFTRDFGKELNLDRVSAPLFVRKSSGLNDNLSGVERPVAFDIPSVPADDVEIVQSLAKWKRMALGEYGYNVGEGLYTNMNAIRRDEELDNLHSAYVDQWDWEKIITADQRNKETLESTVRQIWKVIKHLEHQLWYKFPQAITCHLPYEIQFITSQELLDKYPDKTPKERENAIAKEYGAVFIEKIGDFLSNGEKHDGRAPDYDDWELNGDILVWFDVLDCAIELSSMGIRVDAKSMDEQLKKAGLNERRSLPYHQKILNNELPLTIGGGVGQSRLCMLMLSKAHVGEVQSSLWPDDVREECAKNKMYLL